MNIFIDDERMPGDVTWVAIPQLPEGESWRIVRSHADLLHALADAKHHKTPIKRITFDHDLGFGHGLSDKNTLNGNHCANEVCNVIVDEGWPIPEYTVHSLNPVGAEKIMRTMNDLQRYKEQANEGRA